jgi:chromosome segregation protein
MYLSKLELHGFKSFAERTELQFDPGVTAIVGPNGCGKSNIVDAVRWVIGEQRPTALRSDKMENVIFNGTADRKPLGMAEVQLTIENNRNVLPTEYSEVTIGRRLFRDGKSEYLMNGTQCRLKDITDLFMDTGMGADAYSVIELKMVDEIVSENAEDRRRLFEEAAGITRYKSRRRQALRKLDNTQTDLNRIRDLTDEISTQVRRLERQAEKAEKHAAYEERLHHLELVLAQIEYDRLQAKQRTLQQELDELEATVEAKTAEQNAAEERLERLREQLDEREQVLDERRAALQQHRDTVNELEADQRLQRERLDRARRDRKRLRAAQDEAADRREQLTGEVQRLEAALEQAGPALEQAEQELDEAAARRDRTQEAAETQRDRVQALRQQEQEAAEARTERQRQLDRLTSRLDMLEQDRQRTRDQLDALASDAGALDDRVDEAIAARDDAQTALDAAQAHLDEAKAARARHHDALDTARAELRELERQRDAARAEVDLLDSLVSSYDDFSDAVQFLAADSASPLSDLRTVADVLACDDDVRVALDTALGALAACIVVDDAAAAQAAIARLRDEEQGQATFLVLDRLPDPEPPPTVDGAMPLRDAVRTVSADYDRLADVLLQHTYLADTMEGAQALADELPPPAQVVARTGEWADARGLRKGGSRRTSASPVANRLGRQEQLNQAREALERLEQACAEQQDVVDEHQAALDAVDVEARREAVREAEEAVTAAEQQLERARYEKETLTDRRDELEARLQEIQDELADGRDQAASLEETAAQAETQRDERRAERIEAEDALQQTEAAEREARDAFSEANVAAIEARNRHDNLQRDLERTRERLDDLDTRTEERAQELDDLQETIEAAQDRQSELDAQIESVRAQRAEHDEAVQEAETALHATKSTIAEVETQLRRLRQEREKAMREENQRAVRLAEVQTRTEDLLESIDEDFEVDFLDTAVDIPEDFEESAARDEVQSLRRKVKRLGNVNPLALEEYEEEKERLDFLMEQKDDLESAEETLLETIREINETAAHRFFETYEAIQESFSDIFANLFGGDAKARLELEDPDDPLESTIHIRAKPRGKRPSTLAQLSSGEKALTATALLFAIYLVKPSPFCILDEVDAPLDDANVQRFMRLIRRFEDDTQFILVTHNQRTMALADRMYGITMEEQGVSKLVGVEFDEAMEMTEVG